MTRRRSKWSFAITERLRMDVSITHEDERPVKASLHLRGYIEGKWEPLVRYDTAHDSQHRHQYHPYSSPDRHQFVAILIETFIEAAQTDLTHGAETYLEQFEIELAAKTGERYDETEHDD